MESTRQSSSISRTVEENFPDRGGPGSDVETGTVLGLHGELGAGKTCFVRDLRGAGNPSPGTADVTLINEYRHLALHHVDLYRIRSAEEALGSGLTLPHGDGITAIEWANASSRCCRGTFTFGWRPEQHQTTGSSRSSAGETVILLPSNCPRFKQCAVVAMTRDREETWSEKTVPASSSFARCPIFEAASVTLDAIDVLSPARPARTPAFAWPSRGAGLACPAGSRYSREQRRGLASRDSEADERPCGHRRCAREQLWFGLFEQRQSK